MGVSTVVLSLCPRDETGSIEPRRLLRIITLDTAAAASHACNLNSLRNNDNKTLNVTTMKHKSKNQNITQQQRENKTTKENKRATKQKHN